MRMYRSITRTYRCVGIETHGYLIIHTVYTHVYIYIYR